MDDVFNFLGYSIIWLPLIAGVSWVLFRALYKGTERVSIVIGICAAVTVGFIVLQHYGSNAGRNLTQSDIYEIIDGIIAAIIGIAFWGRRKRTVPSPPPPPDLSN